MGARWGNNLGRCFCPHLAVSRYTAARQGNAGPVATWQAPFQKDQVPYFVMMRAVQVIQLTDGQRLRLDMLKQLVDHTAEEHEALAKQTQQAAAQPVQATTSATVASDEFDGSGVGGAGSLEGDGDVVDRAPALDLLAVLASLGLEDEEEAGAAGVQDAGPASASGSAVICGRNHEMLVNSIGAILKDAANSSCAGPDLWGCLAR